MILKCPECGAGEEDLYAEQDASLIYDVKVHADAPDGIETTHRDQQNFKSWRLGCSNCGAQSDGGDFWTEGWLVEEGKPGLICTICGERVPFGYLRDHLGEHNPNAYDLDAKEARDYYRTPEE